eukprot:2209030-Pleurochrysis_carterae.AAC.2
MRRTACHLNASPTPCAWAGPARAASLCSPLEIRLHPSLTGARVSSSPRGRLLSCSQRSCTYHMLQSSRPPGRFVAKASSVDLVL